MKIPAYKIQKGEHASLDAPNVMNCRSVDALLAKVMNRRNANALLAKVISRRNANSIASRIPPGTGMQTGISKSRGFCKHAASNQQTRSFNPANTKLSIEH